MVFVSLTFLFLFLPCVLGLYYLFSKHRGAQNVLLLLASLFFYASAFITKELVQLYELNFPDHEYFGNIENYTPVTYENCFLGSIGVKVGPYFGGKDDFTVFNPTFPTKFDFTHRIAEQESSYSGTFWEAFINEAMKPEAEPGDFIIGVGGQELRVTLEE